MFQSLRLIYFSPTGTTRKTCEAIAEGLCAKRVVHCDLTLPTADCEAGPTDEVTIIAAPVYAGRVPELFLERIQTLSADNVPTVLVALYGNRAYEDALVELRDVVTTKGFKVIAAGAFIGEHSYSTAQRPIAAGRPDAGDLRLAVEFGRQVAARLERNLLDTPEIRGNVPYRQRPPLGGVAPETDPAKCTLCGACAEVCPPGIVSVADTVVTRAESCIMCCACLRACSFGARVFTHPAIAEKRAMLFSNCSAPKGPELFV
jgi:ferredoxin